MNSFRKNIIMVLTAFFIFGLGFSVGYICFDKPSNQEKQTNILLGQKIDKTNEKAVSNTGINSEKMQEANNQEEISLKKNFIYEERVSNISNINNKISTSSEGNKTATKNNNKVTPNKIAYLTFDDGPSPRVTPQVLDVLKKYNIKATFFVIGDLAEQRPDLIIRAQSEGHFICNHTYSHNYRYIYASTENFLNDIQKCDEVLRSILGDNYKSSIIRFPGGSYGDRLSSFRKVVKDNGYEYVDWDVLSGDAEAVYVSASRLVNRVESTINGKNKIVILNHDANAKQTTVDALPQMIEYLMSQGYTFGTLEEYQS